MVRVDYLRFTLSSLILRIPHHKNPKNQPQHNTTTLYAQQTKPQPKHAKATHINAINIRYTRITVPEPNQDTIKAGALLCPVCCVPYIETEVDFEIDGIILHNIKVLQCPICQDEQFTPDQQQEIEKKLQEK
jgi:hypothetical protein